MTFWKIVPAEAGWSAEQCLPRKTLQTKKVYQGKIRAAAKIILHIIPMLVVPAEFCVLESIYICFLGSRLSILAQKKPKVNGSSNLNFFGNKN